METERQRFLAEPVGVRAVVGGELAEPNALVFLDVEGPRHGVGADGDEGDGDERERVEALQPLGW